MKRISALICTIVILLAISLPVAADEAGDLSEFIIKVANNIDWSDNGPKRTDPLIIGVVGESPIMEKLKELAANNSEMKIEIKSKTFTDDLTDCNLVYTATEELSLLAKVLKQANRSKIITLSSAKDFARYGVMINFVLEDSKLKCEVNKMVLDEAGVKLDSKILKKAIII